MKDLVIEPKVEGKGRSFTATLIASVNADGLWEKSTGSSDASRPVWIMLGGTDNELRPFIANLQLGRKAEATARGYSKKGERFEVLKSTGFQTAWQRTTSGSVATMFLPEMFQLDPGMVDPTGVMFVILPEARVLNETPLNQDVLAYLRAVCPDVPAEYQEWVVRMSPLFIAYLDRRTRCPLVPDPRFYAQCMANALKEGIASLGSEEFHSYNRGEWGKHLGFRFKEYNTKAVGLASGIACRSSHATLEKFLAEQVKVYFTRVQNGT